MKTKRSTVHETGSTPQVTASRDGAGNLTTYLYDIAGNLFTFERGGQRYYVATDQLGTPKTVTDATGDVVKIVEYDSWGVKTSDNNPSFALLVGFAGGITDAATGMVRCGYRDYEPETGRWAAKDPIFFAGGQWNIYAYTYNDPINYFDSNGLGKGGPQKISVDGPYADRINDIVNNKNLSNKEKTDKIKEIRKEIARYVKPGPEKDHLDAYAKTRQRIAKKGKLMGKLKKAAKVPGLSVCLFVLTAATAGPVEAVDDAMWPMSLDAVSSGDDSFTFQGP